MNVEDAIKNRYSVRSYLDKPVEEEKLNKILESARLAPSAGNRQNWKFIVVKDKKTRELLAEAAANQSFVKEASIIIAGISLDPDYIMRCEVPEAPLDLAIAIDHMTLQATELGLGTCWIGAFYQDKVKEILKVPKQYKVIELLTLGYPADRPSFKSRKPLKEIVSYETF